MKMLFMLLFIVLGDTFNAFRLQNPNIVNPEQLNLNSDLINQAQPFTNSENYELLMKQIEEKKRLLAEYYKKTQSQSLENSPPPPIKINTAPQEQSNLINENKNIEANQLRSDDNSILKDEIKPLLKSIADLHYYNYQFLNKIKSSIDDLTVQVKTISKQVSDMNKRPTETNESKQKTAESTIINLSAKPKFLDP